MTPSFRWLRDINVAGGILLPVVTSAQTPTFSLAIHDDRFVPSELEVPAGQKIELIIKNERSAASEFESSDLRREKVVSGGQQISVYVGPLRAGTYEFFDDFHPQTRGHLIVR
jgi:plastocyanin